MKVIQCPCGHIMRAASDDEVIRLAQVHAREVHNMDLSTKEALSMARPEPA
jgi:predicted small metal-binding protein